MDLPDSIACVSMRWFDPFTAGAKGRQPPPICDIDPFVVSIHVWLYMLAPSYAHFLRNRTITAEPVLSDHPWKRSLVILFAHQPF